MRLPSWPIRTKILAVNLGIALGFSGFLLFILVRLWANAGNMRQQGELLTSQGTQIQAQRQQTSEQSELFQRHHQLQEKRDLGSSQLHVVRDAVASFLRLAYQLSDLALGMQSQSEREAKKHHRACALLLDRLAGTDPAAIAGIRQQTDAYVAAMMEAVDSYTEDNRVLGNARVARAQLLATAVVDRLQALDTELEGRVVALDQQLAAINRRLQGSSALVLESAQSLDASRGLIAESASRVIAANAFLRSVAIACMVTGLLGGVAASWMLANSLTSRLARTLRQLDALARGDLTQRQPVDAEDEIGRMTRALNSALDALQASLGTLASTSRSLTGSSQRLVQVSQGMDAEIASTSSEAASASASTTQVAGGMEDLAAGIQEMNQSIGEISRNAAAAATVAREAVGAVTSTSAAVQQLGEASAAIQSIASLITRIAEQTNLLALNATIESARAGEAGHGFAVVAAEVKALARQTAAATADINQRINAIQASSEHTRTAIDQIRDIIRRVDEFQQSIASAVEEQAATTQAIATAVTQAKSGSERIAAHITSVVAAAQKTCVGSAETRRAAADLAGLASQLDAAAQRFVLAAPGEEAAKSAAG